MNNYQLHERLFEQAKQYLEDLDRAFERGSWNTVMRRSQEVVELSLKSVLKLMGIEYPKDHDVARVFSRACNEKGVGVKSEDLVEIEEISAELTRHRAPAFYFDETYSKEQARAAMGQAKKVFNFVQDLVKDLRGSK